jgi:hypothetical protein
VVVHERAAQVEYTQCWGYRFWALGSWLSGAAALTGLVANWVGHEGTKAQESIAQVSLVLLCTVLSID